MERVPEQILDNPSDVLLADIGLRGMSGIEGMRRIHESIPKLAIRCMAAFLRNNKPE
jgi:DNA-binding NarL/FixJ family response regulator